MVDLAPTATEVKNMDITLVAKTAVLTDNIVLNSMFSLSLLPLIHIPLPTSFFISYVYSKKITADCK